MNNSSVSATLTHETGNPKKSYSDKLKSPKWQKKRLDILNLRGFKCEVCGDEENQIQVHHRFYLKGREPWQYDNDVFQVLCEKCHEKSHKKEEKDSIPNRYVELLNHLDLFDDHIISDITLFFTESINEDNVSEIISCFLYAGSIGIENGFRKVINASRKEQHAVNISNMIYDLQQQIIELQKNQKK